MSGETLEFRIVANTANAIRNLADFDKRLSTTGGVSTRQAAVIRQSIESINNVKLRDTLLRNMNKQLNSTAETSRRASTQIKNNLNSINKASSSGSGVLAGFVGGAAVAGILAVTAALKNASIAAAEFSDKASQIEAKLRLATDKAGNYAKAQADVGAISRKTRSDISATADLYSTITRNSEALHLSQKQVATATQTVGMALKIGGAGAAQNAAAILQLSQAMASGKLAGDEFRSLMENAPRLMDLFAASLGVPRGKLKDLAKDGKITGDVISKALTDPKLVADIEKEFGRIPVTFADIGTAAANTAVTFAGAFSKGAGVGNSLAQVLANLQNWAIANEASFVQFGKSAAEAFSSVAEAVKSIYGIVQTVYGVISTNFNAIRAVAIGAATGFAVYRGAVIAAAVANSTFGQSLLFNSSLVLATARNVGIGAAAQVALTGATAGATAGFRAFTAALMANPLGLVAVAISTVVALLIGLASASDDATTATNAKAQADALAAENAQKRADWQMKLIDMTDAEKRASIAAANAAIAKAKADAEAARQALDRAKAELVLAQALGQKQLAAAAGVDGDPASAMAATGYLNDKRESAIQAKINREQKRIQQQEAQQKLLQQQIKDTEASLSKVNAGSTAVGSTDTKTKKSKGGTDPAEQAAKKYADTLKRLKAEVQDLNSTEEQKALLEALESAGLERNIGLTGAKAEEIKKLVSQINDAKKAKAVKEVLDDLDEATRELTYSEVQLAQVEARRRAGLPTDLKIITDQTKKVDEQAAAYYRLQKAKQDAETAKDIAQNQKEREEDAQLAKRGINDPDGAEFQRRNLEIERQRDQERARINELEVITLAQRQAGMTGILQTEKDILIARNESIATQEKANLLQERQTQLARSMSEFMVNLWNDPMAAMKQFFQEFMRRILEAILKALILKETMPGGGSVGGLIGNAILGAIGARAGGGSIAAGNPYIVGEKGPELIVPGRAGQVLNASKTSQIGGGGVSITMGGTSISIGSATPEDRRALAAQMKNDERQKVALIHRELKKLGVTK